MTHAGIRLHVLYGTLPQAARVSLALAHRAIHYISAVDILASSLMRGTRARTRNTTRSGYRTRRAAGATPITASVNRSATNPHPIITNEDQSFPDETREAALQVSPWRESQRSPR